MSAEIITSGCRLNAFESGIIAGHTAHLENTLVVNTCAVTAQAERDARQAIARARRARPGLRIVVTGCAAQLDPARWAALPGVSRVVGNAEKLLAASWAQGAGHACSDIMQARRVAMPLVTGGLGRARAFLAVQQGCDHRCTFCIIPFARGPNRSLPMGDIARQVRALVRAGHAEIVLTGVDIASYGADLPGAPCLGQMVRRLLAAVPELPRLRLSSLDPAAIDEELWALIETEPRLMPHLHLSLQSASTLILKRMKRRHTAEQAGAIIGRARALRPGIAIGADLIAGFPTETDALHAETLDFVRAHAIPYLHVFPYSERPGTPAARMPAIAPAIRRARAAELRAAAADAASSFHAARVGQPAQIVIERSGGEYAAGHTEHFAPVRLAGQFAHARLLRARITEANETYLTAVAA